MFIVRNKSRLFKFVVKRNEIYLHPSVNVIKCDEEFDSPAGGDWHSFQTYTPVQVYCLGAAKKRGHTKN